MIVRILKTLLGIVTGVVLLLVAGMVFVNTQAGRDWMADYISLYSGQEVEINGAATLSITPPGLSLRDVTVADSSSIPWLSIDRVAVSGPRGFWPPTTEHPVVLQVSGVALNTGQLPVSLGRAEADDQPSLVLPPFPLAVRVDDFAIIQERGFPEYRLVHGSIDFDPAGRAVVATEAVLAGNPLVSSISFDLDDSASSPHGVAIDGVVDYFGMVLAADGVVENYRELRGMDIQLTAGGDIGAHSEVASIFTHQNVQGRLTGDWGALVLDLGRLEAVTAHGMIDLVTRLRQTPEGVLMEQGDLSLRADDAGAFLADFGVAFGTSLALVVDADIRGDRQTLRVDRFDMRLGDDEGVLSASGRLNRSGNARGGFELDDGEMSVRVRDVAAMVREFGVEPVLEGGLTGTATFSGDHESLRVDELMVDLGAGAIVVNGAGSARSGGDGGPRVDLGLQARAEAVDRALPRVPMPQWFGGRGTASGTLQYGDGIFGLADLAASFQGEGGDVTLAGRVDDLSNLTARDIHLLLDQSSTAQSTGGLRSLDMRLSLPEGLDGVATVVAEGSVALGEFGFDGVVAEPRERRGISGSFVFEALQGGSGGEVGKSGGGAVLEGEISVVDMETRRFDFSAKVRGTTGSLSYEGVLAQNGGGTGRIRMLAIDPNILTAMAGAQTAFPNLLDMEASVTHSSEGLELNDVSMSTGESRLNGNVSVSYALSEGQNVNLKVEAGSPRLFLADLGLDREPEDKTRYFSRAPLNLRILERTDLDLRLAVDWLHSDALEYRDVQLTGTSREGVLQVSSSQQLLGGGNSTLELDVDVRGDRPQVAVELAMNGIDPGELSSVKGSGESYSGDIDMEVEIRGAGDSVNEIMSRADGHFLVRINRAVIPNRKLDLLSTDFLFEALRMVNPFIRQASEMEIECGLIGFLIRDGTALADKTVVIKGQRVLILGEGEIDLGSEKVSMAIRPKAQEGIGLNTSGLVKFIGIGGTLMNPDVRTDTKGLLMSGASLGAAVASGGMSLFLQNMFDRATSGSRDCERVEAVFRDQMKAAPPAPSTRQAPVERHPGAR